jgi:hypothetical protein
MMKPLYKYSVETAKHNGKLEDWRESRNENIRCRDFLDKQVREKFDGFRLPDECAENTIREFGYDRTMWVIANTILERRGDGRFNERNRKWAQSLNIAQDRHNYEFALESHSCTVNGLANDVRKMYAELGLFSGEHIVKTDEQQDYTGKLLVIREDVLKEECRTPENQLFLARGGFGCSPNSRGRKLFGQFLSDGEKTHFYREDFVGILDEQYFPQWASEKMEQLHEQQEEQKQEINSEQTINLNM